MTVTVEQRSAVCDLAQRWYDELKDRTPMTRVWTYSEDLQAVLCGLHDLLFMPDSTAVHECIMAWVVDWLKLRTECRAEFEAAESDEIPDAVTRRLKKLPMFYYDMLAVSWLRERRGTDWERDWQTVPHAVGLLASETSRSPRIQPATQTALGGIWMRAMSQDRLYIISVLEKMMRVKVAGCE